MINLVSNILQELQYNSSATNEDYYSMLFKESEDYFIVAEYESSELVDFFNTPKTKSILSYFQSEKEKNSAINKNTSLIILVKTESPTETLETHKNNIFNIEEDEYILRKYVILYTEEGLGKIEGKSINELNEIVKNVNRFLKYQEYETRYQDEAYFLVMQLFVKLPPLSFTGYDNDFENIRDRIDSSIGGSGIKLVHHILTTTSIDVKENRPSLLEVQNDDFDKWLEKILDGVNDEAS